MKEVYCYLNNKTTFGKICDRIKYEGFKLVKAEKFEDHIKLTFKANDR